MSEQQYWIQQFNADVTQLSQQKGSKLRGSVMIKQMHSEIDNTDRLAPSEAYDIVGRNAATVHVTQTESRRGLIAAPKGWSFVVDKRDKARMIADPMATYGANGAMAMGRKIDDVIIAAATGTALNIDENKVQSTVALPAAQTIDKSFGTGSDTPLSIEKMTRARRLLEEAHLDVTEEFFIVANAAMIEALLLDPLIQSVDTNNVRALVDGKVDHFMGFRFLRTERLLGAGTAGDPTLALVYPRSAITLGILEDITVSVDKLPTQNNGTQILMTMDIGAVRNQEVHMIAIECVATA